MVASSSRRMFARPSSSARRSTRAGLMTVGRAAGSAGSRDRAWAGSAWPRRRGVDILRAMTRGMRIGAHVSVAGGLLNAVGNARETGSEAFQVFVSNARAWAPPVDEPAVDERFRELVADAGLGPVFAHAPYLVNFASTNELTYRRSRDVTLATLRKAAAIGAVGVVVHAGSDLGAGRERGLERTRSAILPLLDLTEGVGEGADRPPELLLEFTAGTRNAIASRFEEMAELLQRLGDHPRVKVCFDTCHAHAAGYDLSTAAGATAVMTE